MSVTFRDVHEIVSKLSSDKVKSREDGIKLLNSWLEGDKSTIFCTFISAKSAMVKPNQVPNSETWPFLITLLSHCVALEVSSCKKRLPKLIFVKTLRVAIQRAEAGGMLFLLPAVRSLFTHILDVSNAVPSFQCEYGVILRHLLSVPDYRLHLRKRTYSGLVLLYMEKVEQSVSMKTDNQPCPREDVFRSVLTLHSLLDNPPGDSTDVNQCIVSGFVKIFSFVSDDGKVTRKLMECINTFLLKEGPNLSFQLIEIHNAVQKFVFSYWFSTHDRFLKDALVSYTMLQLRLVRGEVDRNLLLEQLLDVVIKELDQCCVVGVSWADTLKEDKSGSRELPHCFFLEFAAVVLYRACFGLHKTSPTAKRARKEHIAFQLREELMNGKWQWIAAFCSLLHYYSNHISKDILVYWFEGMSTSFQRVLNEANSGHSYDVLLWSMRALRVLSSILAPSIYMDNSSEKSNFSSNKVVNGWYIIWNSLIHGLPIFSNVSSVVDATMLLLGDIIYNDILKPPAIQQDVWDLHIFRNSPSMSILYFISCYFLRMGFEIGVRDNLVLRQNLLRAVLGVMDNKAAFLSHEGASSLVPAAIFSLCCSCSSLPTSSGIFKAYPFIDGFAVSPEIEDSEGGIVLGRFECFAEVLAEIDMPRTIEARKFYCHQNASLQQQLQRSLLNEADNSLTEFLVCGRVDNISISTVFSICSFLSNTIYCSILNRSSGGSSSFILKRAKNISEFLDKAINIIQDSIGLAENREFLALSSIFDGAKNLTENSRIFTSSPLFHTNRDTDAPCFDGYDDIVQSAERFLRTLTKVYEEMSIPTTEFDSDPEAVVRNSISANKTDRNSESCSSRIVDMELDVVEDCKDVGILDSGGKTSVAGLSFISLKQLKLDIISLISCFFSIAPDLTWDLLFSLLDVETDIKVLSAIGHALCRYPKVLSSTKLMKLINHMDDMLEIQRTLKIQCTNNLCSLCLLIKNLVLFKTDPKTKNMLESSIFSEECHSLLGDLINKVLKLELSWVGRINLVDCVCNFIFLNPEIGQTMIGRLMLLLRDNDYRVRFYLARRIGILFETWDGHDELFHDICSSFGIKLIMSTKEKLVSAETVLAAGPQSCQLLETVIVTLTYLALHSEKIEFEAVFMICVIAAVDPSQRELVFIALDNLSKRLKYSSRSKYLDELLGSIIFCWVACGVSLAAFVEIRELFVLNTEPAYFVGHCCSWLVPILVLNNDVSNLKWLSKVASQPLEVLVEDYFVPIFSICFGAYCTKNQMHGKAETALHETILRVAKISEIERDALTKKHMVSIVGHIVSLASTMLEPPLPFLSREATLLALRTLVDGFSELNSVSKRSEIVDKLGIFQSDRVFMFLVDLHYKIAAAVNDRHRCHRMAALEVLVNALGHRSAICSTSSYLFNLVGQYIGFPPLQEQCCKIISAVLNVIKHNISKGSFIFFSEQLQYLVSRLVSCCMASISSGEFSCGGVSTLLSLLGQLTLEADSSLHGFIRELEPFPDLDIFYKIRSFHEKLCASYSPKDHILKLSKRSGVLPPRLLSWSLQALHKKLMKNGSFGKQNFGVNESGGDAEWQHDLEIRNAVWMLVRSCGSDDASGARGFLSDFVSKVGIGDPHCAVFHLPQQFRRVHVFGPKSLENVMENGLQIDTVIPDEILTSLIRLLKKYLLDESVHTIDMTSHALRGILSTERGQRLLMSYDMYERSLIEVHSKGVDLDYVEKQLVYFQRKFKDQSISLEGSELWKTQEKSFANWICPLVSSLIGFSNDTIIRLCQDIVLLKSEVAELLLPSVFISLSDRKDLKVDLCGLISSQMVENIFVSSNKMMKSIQVILDVLNELRLCYVIERLGSSSQNPKAFISSSKSRSPSLRTSRIGSTKSPMAISTSAWDKVYWLSIDYLLVAKSAISCGSYFTSVMYVEYWCEASFNSLVLGNPVFSNLETIPAHMDILLSAVTRINEPDSLYGIIQSHKLSSQVITFEHEGNWSKALEYYDLQVRSEKMKQEACENPSLHSPRLTTTCDSFSMSGGNMGQTWPLKGLIKSLQHIGCAHLLELYCQGLTSHASHFLNDSDFSELQYEAAWRNGNWEYSSGNIGETSYILTDEFEGCHFNRNLHRCLRSLKDGDFGEFHSNLDKSKQEIVLSICNASEESTDYIYSSIVKLQIFYHLGLAWNLRWTASIYGKETPRRAEGTQHMLSDPLIPTVQQVSVLDLEWGSILLQSQLHMNLLEPFIAFRRVLLQIMGCRDSVIQHLLQSASILRKGSRYSQAAAFLHEFKLRVNEGKESGPYWPAMLEEAKLLRSQGQHQIAINVVKYIAEKQPQTEDVSNVYRLVGKWLAENGSGNSRTILEKYLKQAVSLSDRYKSSGKSSVTRQSQMQFHLAHYADGLFRSCEERLSSSEWQAAMRLRKHKTTELEALIKRLRSSSKGQKVDCSAKIQELQKQLAMDREEAQKLQDDRDNFLKVALEGYQRCLILGDKYDIQAVFRLVALWFSLFSRKIIVDSMLGTISEVQSYKFIPLVYQIASRMGSSKDKQGPHSFQFAVVSLVKKMAIDHPYHTIFQLLALANGDRIKDKQRSRSSFVVDMDKKLAAENLLKELSSYHGAVILQMKQMVEIYIKLAEMETKREDTNKKVALPKDIRSTRQLELVPVVTSTFPVDHSCQYLEGSFPHFRGLDDSVTIMNGINAPKVVQCLGSDGRRYRQLAKSGNDDLRQDAVMEQFFGLVNTFLKSHRDTWKRGLGIRTYKVVPFTPSAGVLEWVDGTLPLGEYLIGSMRSGGAHGRYGVGEWPFLKCREHLGNVKDKRKAFQEICNNFRPVMHHFFLERFLVPAEWFEKRLSYTRSVAATSMVGYIVGLGDRHSMNILIDQSSAEVVHIDLGVAFEQGLMLKTPERVPFRLTRDIVDGMGVAGVEGVFRRCCEETLSLMRVNKEALLTIVEVFIHDPLYKWALSPLKALRRQKEVGIEESGGEMECEEEEEGYEGNKDGARALMRVKQKLDGYEEGEMRNVHGQVQQLIQDAVDPDRLCHMFPGWAPWL